MMATSCASPRSTFTFIWTIENYSELTYIDLRSPIFVIKRISDKKWYLEIVEYFGFSCRLLTNDSSEGTEDLDFEFSFLGADGSPIVSKKCEEPGRFFVGLMNRADFLERWAELLPNNTLTIQCRMWRRDREIPTDVCYARTRLQTHTGSFIWTVKEFSTLPCSHGDFRALAPGERKVYLFKPLTKKGPFMALILYLKRNSESSEDVSVGFLVEKCRDYAYSCELSVLDVTGEVIVSKVERCRTDYVWAMLTFDPLISKNKLMANKNVFLPNDTLVLKVSFEVCTGVISNELEYFTPNVYSIAEEKEEVIDFNVIAAEADYSLEFEEYFVN